MTDLPKHVYAVKDRHGKIRYRFRKTGLLSRYLPEPGAEGFDLAYQQCFDPAEPRRVRARPTIKRKVSWAQYRGKSLVYFIGGRSGAIKIGTTVNLPARLKKLQTSSPIKLRILACVEGGVELESAYHRMFADRRIGWEWFDGKGAIRDEIKRLNDGGVVQPLLSNHGSGEEDAGISNA